MTLARQLMQIDLGRLSTLHGSHATNAGPCVPVHAHLKPSRYKSKPLHGCSVDVRQHLSPAQLSVPVWAFTEALVPVTRPFIHDQPSCSSPEAFLVGPALGSHSDVKV